MRAAKLGDRGAELTDDLDGIATGLTQARDRQTCRRARSDEGRFVRSSDHGNGTTGGFREAEDEWIEI
jgi:hypothetical protein